MQRPDDSSAELARSAYGASRISTPRLELARTVETWRERAFTVDDLAATVRERNPRVGLATVYRAVAAMQEAGFVEQIGSRNGATLYARCRSGGHHHHMICTQCGAVADVECPPQLSVARAAGFEVTGHSLVLYGLCGSCATGSHDAPR